MPQSWHRTQHNDSEGDTSIHPRVQLVWYKGDAVCKVREKVRKRAGHEFVSLRWRVSCVKCLLRDDQQWEPLFVLEVSPSFASPTHHAEGHFAGKMRTALFVQPHGDEWEGSVPLLQHRPSNTQIAPKGLLTSKLFGRFFVAIRILGIKEFV